MLEIYNNGDLPFNFNTLSEVGMCYSLGFYSSFNNPKHHILFFWIVILTLESPHPNQKERFYQQKGHLAEPSSPELARFINMCLTYEPEERPSFRKVLRELIELMRKGQCLLDYFISFFKTLLQFIQ